MHAFPWCVTGKLFAMSRGYDVCFISSRKCNTAHGLSPPYSPSHGVHRELSDGSAARRASSTTSSVRHSFWRNNTFRLPGTACASGTPYRCYAHLKSRPARRCGRAPRGLGPAGESGTSRSGTGRPTPEPPSRPASRLPDVHEAFICGLDYRVRAMPRAR